jgi:anti-sigma regulatory factor (Ser/Thr protein kinase)
MYIETSAAAKHFFSKTSLALVYFEALANALDAAATEVFIDIDVEVFDRPKTLKITISDNGDSFTDKNFERFKILLKPRDHYHKGLGRFVFLHYFQYIEIDSVWGNNRRTFKFQKDFDGDVPVQEYPNNQKIEHL